MSEWDGRKGGRGRCLRPKRRPRSVVNSFINKSSYAAVRCPPGRQIKRIVVAARPILAKLEPTLSSSVLVLMLSFVRCFRVSPSALSLAFPPGNVFAHSASLARSAASSSSKHFPTTTYNEHRLALFYHFCNPSRFGLTSFLFFAETCQKLITRGLRRQCFAPCCLS